MANFEDLTSAKREDGCPKALLLLVTCVDSEFGVSLPIPVTSPAIFLQCDLGCDYLCLVSPSVQKIVFDPFIFQKFFGSSGTIVVSFLGLWVIVSPLQDFIYLFI